MIGIRKDDGSVKVIPEIPLAQPFDGSLSTDRHEDGRRYIAMFGVENARTGTRYRTFGKAFPADLARQDSIVESAHLPRSRHCSFLRGRAALTRALLRS